MEPEKTEPIKNVNPLLDEVRAEREALEKVRDEAKSQADRLEQLRSDHLLSGTGGARPVDEKPKKTDKERAVEYAQSIMKGKLKDE